MLLFDELVFLDSQPWFIRQELIGNEYATDNPDLEDKFDYLKNEEIVSIYNPRELIKEYDELLTANVINDIHNEDFYKQAVNYNTETWSVMTDRLPPSFLDYFYPGAGTFSESIGLQSLLENNGELLRELESQPLRELANDEESDFPPAELDFFALAKFHHLIESNKSTDEKLEILWNMFDDRYKYVVGGNPHVEMETAQIPFLQASSLRINEALLVSSMEGLIPFTDSSVHDRLLRAKVSNSISSLSNNPEVRERLEIDVPVNLPQQHLAVAILDQLFPQEELQQRPLKELVEYRLSHSDQFSNFHTKISELASEINSISPSPEYMKNVQEVVKSEVIPELEKARDDLITEYEKSFGELAFKSAQVITPTILATTFAGLGIWEVLGACALAEVGVLTSEGANNLVRSWNARRQFERTPFAYFSDL